MLSFPDAENLVHAFMTKLDYILMHHWLDVLVFKKKLNYSYIGWLQIHYKILLFTYKALNIVYYIVCHKDHIWIYLAKFIFTVYDTFVQGPYTRD